VEKFKHGAIMKQDDMGGSPLRSETAQGTPKEISSTSGQMKVSPKNTAPLGTRKRTFLMECEEDISTGELTSCRRIPVYDEPFPGTVTDRSGNVPDVAPITSRQSTANRECTQTSCAVPRRLHRSLRQSTSQTAVGRELSQKD
jgi:hypothetical protein